MDNAEIQIDTRHLYAEDLKGGKDNATKLLLLFIHTMAGRDGYCWASNEYLAELMGESKRNIQYRVEDLIERGYLFREVVRDDKNVVKHRLLFTRKDMYDMYLKTKAEQAEQGIMPEDYYYDWLED